MFQVVDTIGRFVSQSLLVFAVVRIEVATAWSREILRKFLLQFFEIKRKLKVK